MNFDALCLVQLCMIATVCVVVTLAKSDDRFDLMIKCLLGYDELNQNRCRIFMF